VVFVDGVRTPFGKAGPKGLYAETRADDLIVRVIRELRRAPGELIYHGNSRADRCHYRRRRRHVEGRPWLVRRGLFALAGRPAADPRGDRRVSTSAGGDLLRVG
jgi:hypothetical protein